MTLVVGIQGSVVTGAAGRVPHEHLPAKRDAEAATGRALVPLQPVEPSAAPVSGRPQASYLAQLIATKQQLPQTRERRRAEPEDAVAVYAAANAGPRPSSGRRLVREM